MGRASETHHDWRTTPFASRMTESTATPKLAPMTMRRPTLLLFPVLLPFLTLLAIPRNGHAATHDMAACAAASGTRSEVRVQEAELAGVPALLRVPPHVSRPPIVLWHGFGAPASERALMAQLPLDDVPAVKVYLGLPLFGARSPADKGELARRQATDLAMQVFEPVVRGAARELPAVTSALRDNGCLRAGERIGLFGFSAGGAAALDALVRREVPVAAAVLLNASTGLGSLGGWVRARNRQAVPMITMVACPGARNRSHRPRRRYRGRRAGVVDRPGHRRHDADTRTRARAHAAMAPHYADRPVPLAPTSRRHAAQHPEPRRPRPHRKRGRRVVQRVSAVTAPAPEFTSDGFCAPCPPACRGLPAACGTEAREQPT